MPEAISCFASNFSGDVSRFVTRAGSSAASALRFPRLPMLPSAEGRIGLEEEDEAEPEEAAPAGGAGWPGRRMLGVKSAPLRWSASFIESVSFVPVTLSTLT